MKKKTPKIFFQHFQFFFLTVAFFLLLVISSCKKELVGESYDPEGSTNTISKPIAFQEKQHWYFENSKITFSNDFTGARLNNVTRENDSLYICYIQAENTPVNKSPWYGFKIWSEQNQNITLQLEYSEGYAHRYYPDISYDAKNWVPLDSSRFQYDSLNNTASLKLEIYSDTIYVAAQEVIPSEMVFEYIENLTKANFVTVDSAGSSTLGTTIPVVKIGNQKSKNVIVVLGRQHPPETTGYLALQAFINRIIEMDKLAVNFRNEYQLLLFPMVNPDGVDLGHWRHNAGGIDTNRDWQYFNQPEPVAIKDYMIEFQRNYQAQILFEIDFHSTQEDLFYVFDKDKKTNLTGFTHQWLDSLDHSLDYYTADRIPTSGNSPVSTQWFYTQFNSEAVTYEVGDDSPRDKIKEISETAAVELMKILTE